MSYLLESLGRGLLTRLADAFGPRLAPGAAGAAELAQRVRQCPTSVDLATQLAARQLAEGEWLAARAGFARALALAPDDCTARLGLACALDELDDLPAALCELERVGQADPGDPAVWFAVGLCHERLERPDRAAEAYREALRRCARMRNAHERLAALALRGGDAAGAAAQAQALCKLAGQETDLLVTLGGFQLGAGAAREAARSFHQALLIEPQAGDSPALDARPQSRGELLEWIAELEALVAAHPQATEYRIHLGDLYVKLGEDERAVGEYQAAIDLQPTLMEATVKLGTQHLRRERYVPAAEAFNRAVELNDRMLTAFVGLGVAQLAAGAQADADATFGLVVSLAPNSTLLFTEALRLYHKSQRQSAADALEAQWAEAPDAPGPLEALAAHWDRALRGRSADAGLHYRRGLLARQLGAFHDSLGALRRATELYPAFSRAQIQLGAALWEVREPAAARACFQRAVLCAPDEVAQHYELALLCTRRARFDLAFEQVTAGVRDEDERCGIDEIVTLALQHAGMLDRAAAGWQAIRSAPAPWSRRAGSWRGAPRSFRM